MATEIEKKEEWGEGLPLREVSSPQVQPQKAPSLEESLIGLRKFNGFQLIKGLVSGLDRMDPKRKAVKDIFLAENTYSDTRKRIYDELSAWLTVLESDEVERQTELVEKCERQREKALDNLKENIGIIREKIDDLERSYRSLNFFFANTGQSKIDYLTLINVDKSQLSDKSSSAFKAVEQEIEEYFDQLDLRDSYSLLVIPGYLGDKVAIRNWADVAYKNKVILVTDFEDSPDYGMLMEALKNADLQDMHASFGNVIMTCNYIVGRGKSEYDPEKEVMYIPGSAALAGRMSNIDDVTISQGVAGMKYGVLDNVRGARLKLRKSEIASIIDMGMIPIIEERGGTMAFSNRSLYNGATDILQEYTIVRVFDWIGKVIEHFCNTQAFIMWDSKVEDKMTRTINDFLIEYKGPGELYEDYTLNSINMDAKTQDISVSLDITPFYAARNFLIEIKGKPDKKHNSVEW